MGCCSSGRGCSNGKCLSGCNKLDVHNWLGDLPQSPNATDWVEIRFKNTRKGFYKNVNNLKLNKGDAVAVEASPGHDIGVVSLTGELVLRQMKKYNYNDSNEPKKIYRKAKPVDIEKWEAAMSREHDVMIETRRICRDMELDMKVSDVEFQGDGTKAIFYYIAKERVDFRELIKVLAERFRIRIEMKQIGARQEAGRVGGIGTCGRELCCSTWVTNFVTVTTSAARYQELSLNPQKLAGQCGKLKCCLNYELDSYMDAQSDFPNTTTVLETEAGMAFHFKTDIFKRIMWYSFDSGAPVNVTPVPVDRVKEIIRQNKQGKKVEKLISKEEAAKINAAPIGFVNTIEEGDLDRFEDKVDIEGSSKRKPANKQRRKPNSRPGGRSQSAKDRPRRRPQRTQNPEEKQDDEKVQTKGKQASRPNDANKGKKPNMKRRPRPFNKKKQSENDNTPEQ